MEKTLQVYLPYPKATITQRFGDNANPLYAAQGLKGHPSYDWGALWDAVKKAFIGAFWGAPIPNCTPNAYCYSIMHQNDPVLMDYRAAFFIVETETGVYEVSYGHMSTILAIPGRTYQVGETIGLVGNTGPVYAGSHEVTEAEKRAGSHAGEHLHGPQIRPVQKVKETDNKHQYLNDANGIYRDTDGFYYLVPNFNNGYNGCISMAPFSTETLATDYKAPVDPAVVAALVNDTAKAVDIIKTLPKEQQNTLYERVKSILLALLPFLKG